MFGSLHGEDIYSRTLITYISTREGQSCRFWGRGNEFMMKLTRALVIAQVKKKIKKKNESGKDFISQLNERKMSLLIKADKKSYL